MAAGVVENCKQEPPRELISDLVAKKREIFLVQMGLDTKRQEIDKLLQQSAQRAQALDKAETLLDDDSSRFEEFLKQNAESLQEAMSHADTQTKAKNEKVRLPANECSMPAALRYSCPTSWYTIAGFKQLQTFSFTFTLDIILCCMACVLT